MELKPYPKYKDSGVEWLGEVPGHWNVKRLKYISIINPSRTIDVSNDFPCVFIPMEAMNTDGTFDNFTTKPFSELKVGFTYFAENDVIFAKITPCFENGKGALLKNLGSEIGFGSTEFHVLRAVKKWTIPKFLYYLTISGVFRRIGEAFMRGVAGQKRVTNDFVQDFSVGVPSIEEQWNISQYLDRKTAKIDDLIKKNKRLVELLKEKRQAIISHAVTKGLDPEARMKDSGVEWLGEIPEGWEIKKLKYLSKKIGSGITPKGGSAVYLTEGIPILRSQNIHFDRLQLNDVAYISEDIHKEMGASRVLSGDVLLNITGASIGRCNYWREKQEANVNQHVCIIRPNELAETKYLYYCLSSVIGQYQIEYGQNGISREGLNYEDLSRFIIPLPLVGEQIQTIDYLDQKTVRIDDLTKKIQSQIETLKEYRQALISNVVTGKIDVKEEQP